MIRVQVKARQVDCRAVVVLGQEVDARAHLGEVPAVVDRAVAVEVHVLHRGGPKKPSEPLVTSWFRASLLTKWLISAIHSLGTSPV